MNIINNLLRKNINKKNRKNIKNKDFSIIASNCNGACILHDLGLEFKSPFVNLWLYPEDFIKYLKNIEYYNAMEMEIIDKEGFDYPVGKIGDIEVYFLHYDSKELAKEKWEVRKKRIIKDNIFIMFTDRDGCTYEDLVEFDNLPYENKVVFTCREYKDIKSSFVIKGFEGKESVGICSLFINKFSGKKYYDFFPYVKWFNGEM